jgi:hypothetical protein
MTIPYLSQSLARVRGLFVRHPTQLTHHEQIVQFWVRLVVATFAGMAVLGTLSISMWWVTPDSLTPDVEVIAEEKPKPAEGEYDVGKAEKLLSVYEDKKAAHVAAPKVEAASALLQSETKKVEPKPLVVPKK